MPNVMPLHADDPRRVGRYRLTGRMGSRTGVDGSTLRVFTAKMVDGDTVLVTLLGSDRVADAAARDRFTAEARVARRVAPFCVARILDAGVEGGGAYLVAEYVPGPTLTEAVGSAGPLPQPSLEAFAIGTATGLMAIHQTGLVHGELGPEHVVLGPDGPRVTHFGITPPYGAATPAADVRAWANTVMFAAVGRRPTGPQDLAALADDLREVLAACLVPDAGSRPVARAVLIQLLGQRDLSSGLLAEGSRRARAAASLPEPSPPTGSQQRSGPVPAPCCGPWHLRYACSRSWRRWCSSPARTEGRPPSRAPSRRPALQRTPPRCPGPCLRPVLRPCLRATGPVRFTRPAPC